MGLLSKISLYSDPQMLPESKTPIGGFLTILLPPIIVGYVLWQVITGLDAPIIVSFIGMGQVIKLPSPLRINFECTSGSGCIVCPLPCNNAIGKISVASGAKTEVTVPFFALQNTHSAIEGSVGVQIGLARDLDKEPGKIVKIGQLAGDIDVVIPKAQSNPSIKLLPSNRQALDKSTAWEYTPDDSSDCTDKQRDMGKVVADLDNLAPTSSLYPVACPSDGGGCNMFGTSSVIHYSTICSSSVYFKLKEEQQSLLFGSLIGQVGGFYGVVAGCFAMINSGTWRRYNAQSGQSVASDQSPTIVGSME